MEELSLIGERDCLIQVPTKAEVVAPCVVGRPETRRRVNGAEGCVACGGVLKRRERPRELVGLVGDYTLRRAYYWCAVCMRGEAPLYEALGLGPGGVSPGLARVVAGLDRGSVAERGQCPWAAVEATCTPAA